MDSKVNPDQIIQDIGGCGRYQWRMSIVIHTMQISITWNVLLVVFATNTPRIWYCDDEGDDVIYNTNSTVENSKMLLRSCTTLNGSTCTKFRFEGANTLVSSVRYFTVLKVFIKAHVLTLQNCCISAVIYFKLFYLLLSILFCYYSSNLYNKIDCTKKYTRYKILIRICCCYVYDLFFSLTLYVTEHIFLQPSCLYKWLVCW